MVATIASRVTIEVDSKAEQDLAMQLFPNAEDIGISIVPSKSMNIALSEQK